MITSEISDEFLKTKNSSWDMFLSADNSIDDLDFDIIQKAIESGLQHPHNNALKSLTSFAGTG